MMAPSKGSCSHPLLDVYSTQTSAPTALEVTFEEAKLLVEHSIQQHYADCTFCGVTVIGD